MAEKMNVTITILDADNNWAFIKFLLSTKIISFFLRNQKKKPISWFFYSPLLLGFYSSWSSSNCLILFNNIPQPSATQVSGDSAIKAGIVSSSSITSTSPVSCAPPPVRITPFSTISPASSGGVCSNTFFVSLITKGLKVI